MRPLPEPRREGRPSDNVLKAARTAIDSKPLRKAESNAARLTQRVFEGRNVHGTDVDLLYRTDEGWVVLEFLKCDNPRVTPATSHPSRYWYNWRKFRKLVDLARDLHARLYLVNYEEAGLEGGGQYRIMEVDLSVLPTSKTVIATQDIEANCGFERFQRWLLELNERGHQDLERL